MQCSIVGPGPDLRDIVRRSSSRGAAYAKAQARIRGIAAVARLRRAFATHPLVATGGRGFVVFPVFRCRARARHTRKPKRVSGGWRQSSVCDVLSRCCRWFESKVGGCGGFGGDKARRGENRPINRSWVRIQRNVVSISICFTFSPGETSGFDTSSHFSASVGPSFCRFR